MKKKTITVCTFMLIILVTVIWTVGSAVESYRYDMDPANGVDILEGFGAVLTILVGAFIVFYELDLFCVIYYFLNKPRTIAKSILHILAHVSLLLVCFNDFYKDIFSEDVIAPLIVFVGYLVLRITCFLIPGGALEAER